MRSLVILRPLALLVALLAIGCGTRSSAYRTAAGPAVAYRGAVRVVAAGAPAGGREVGIVQVDSVEELANAVQEFERRVAELGGDTGVIDRYSTTYEWITTSYLQAYSCGTQQSPRTCMRTVHREQEVATLHLVGRALSTRSTP